MSREYILNGVYVSERGTRSEILAPGVYLNETVPPFVSTDRSVAKPVRRAPIDGSVSLNLSLIAVVATAPFFQTDFAKPFFPRALPDVSQPLNLNLFKNPVPNNQFDWSLPLRVPHITPDASRATNPNLQKNAIPFAQYDWSKPSSPLPQPTPMQAYSNALYTIVVVAVPFNQTDWAVPQRLKALPQPPDALNPNLFTNPFPFNQFDWLKPFRVPLALAQPSPPVNINIFTNPIPFANLDRAIPFNLRGPPDQSQPYNPNLYGVVTVSLPFNQTDWTPARRPLPRLSDDPPNFQLLVSVAPGATPELHSKPFFATVGQLMGM